MGWTSGLLGLTVVIALSVAPPAAATVAPVATTTPRASGVIDLAGCAVDSVAFSADGSLLYVAGGESRFVCVVNTRSRNVIRRIPLGPSNRWAGSSLALSADGATMYAARTHDTGFVEGSLVIIDIRTGKLKTTPRPRLTWPDGQPVLGPDGRPLIPGVFDIALSRDGARVLAIGDTNAVIYYDIPSGAWSSNYIETGSTPASILLSPDGATAYVSGGFQEFITTIDVAGWTGQIGRRSYGAYMPPMGISPDGTRLYAAIRDKAQVLTIGASDMQILNVTRLRPDVLSLAVNPASGQVWVTEDRNTSAWVTAHPFSWRAPRITILAADGTVRSTFSVGGGSARQGPVFFSPNGRMAFVAEMSMQAPYATRLIVVNVPR